MGALLSTENNDEYLQDSSCSEDEEDPEENSTNEEPHRRLSPNYDEITRLAYDLTLDSATDTTDAAPPAATMTITLTVDQVMVVENHLDTYEKVSLVYLLYDNPAVALEHLTKLVNGSNDKLIYNWAIFQNLKNLKWQEKLVEALCIIQNYEVVRMLGFTRDNLVVRFSPHLYFVNIYVNKIRKALYCLCEAFDSTDGDNLLGLVCPDFQNKGFNFKVYNPEYLELYLLHWEIIGYIKQDNLTNLCAILKVMDQLDWYEKLKQLIPAVVTHSSEKTKTSLDSKKPKSIFDDILNPSSSLFSLQSSLDTPISADNAVFVNSDNKYDVNPGCPGVCLIINQENFYREIEPSLQELLPPSETKLDPRMGTQHDKRKLIETFEQFGFRIETADNLTHSDIPKEIEKVMNSITTESSFFVCIMSHGDEGVIYGVNSCRVPVKKLKNLLCSKNRRNLSGKPKVLILQSCQGTRCQPIASFEPDNDNIVIDGPSMSTSEVIPPLADLFTFWATVPGYGAIRNKKTGSWFIQSLCEKLTTLGDKHHFEDICTSVVRDVSSKKWSQITEEVAMVPSKDSTFRKLFYFPPIRK